MQRREGQIQQRKEVMFLEGLMNESSANDYESPIVLELGKLSELTQGGGGEETDDCSSGYYTPSDE